MELDINASELAGLVSASLSVQDSVKFVEVACGPALCGQHGDVALKVHPRAEYPATLTPCGSQVTAG